MHLSYDRFGSGEPLLLIQGMSGHRRMWGPEFLGELAGDFDVVAYDHRGVGESDRAQAFTIADLADDAAELMTRLGWESAHIVGISMGGMVAQELALNHPERVRTLTLGCTSAGGFTAESLGPGLIRVIEAVQGGDRDEIRQAGYEANLSPAFRADPANLEPYAATALSVKVPGPVIQLQITAGGAFDVTNRVGALTMPVLVVHGTADDMIPVSNGVDLGARIPGSKVELLDGVGHLFWWEEPGKSANLIRAHALG